MKSEKEVRAWCLTALNDYALRKKLPLANSAEVLTLLLASVSTESTFESS